MTDEETTELARKIAHGEIFAGDIIAEFANGHDAADFARMKGGAGRYTVTPGINLVFAVRPWCVQPFAHAEQCDHCGGFRNQHATDCDRPLDDGTMSMLEGAKLLPGVKR